MLTHQGTRTIVTQRLTLRAFRAEDAQDMFENWASDERVTRYLTWPKHETPDFTRRLLEDWCKRYADPAYYNWAIEFSGRVIGNISAVRVDGQSENAELGYCMGVDYWRRGIMPEAAGAVIDFFFSAVGMHRVGLFYARKNPASGRVAEKCGMRFEGTRRESYKTLGGEFLDISYCGILQSDWAQRKGEAEG